MSKILVYGGSGIISTDIVNKALSLGHSITVVNRGKHKQLFDGNVNSIIADLRNDSIEDLTSKITETYDAILDFVSYTPGELEKNLGIVKGKFKQYIFISSATAYNTKQGRYKESDEIGKSSWSYAVNKSLCEKLLIEKARLLKFDYTIIRPYVTYNRTRIPFQFSPLEYYTIVNRMRCNKCVPLLKGDNKCTLTWSADFAVGAVALIMNEKAYNQAVHITGCYETTWNNALNDVAKAFGTNYDIVKLSKKAISNKRITKGLNVEEVIADKSRDMIFDNSKICSLSDSFRGNTSLSDALPEIVSYFDNKDNRIINYAWDGRLDYFLSKSGLLAKEQKKQLHFVSCEKTTLRDRIKYTVNRYGILFYIYHLIFK